MAPNTNLHSQTHENAARKLKEQQGGLSDTPFLDAMRGSGLLRITGSEATEALDKEKYTGNGLEFAARVAHVLFSDEHINRQAYSGAFIGFPEVTSVLDFTCGTLGFYKGGEATAWKADYNPSHNLSSEDFLNGIYSRYQFMLEKSTSIQRQHIFLLIGHVAMVAGRPDLVRPLIEDFNERPENTDNNIDPSSFSRVFEFAYNCESVKCISRTDQGGLPEQSNATLVFGKHAEYFTGSPLYMDTSD